MSAKRLKRKEDLRADLVWREACQEAEMAEGKWQRADPTQMGRTTASAIRPEELPPELLMNEGYGSGNP